MGGGGGIGKEEMDPKSEEAWTDTQLPTIWCHLIIIYCLLSSFFFLSILFPPKVV